MSEGESGGFNTRQLFTRTFMFLCKFDRTLNTNLAALAGASPGRSQRGAALRLQRGSVDVDLAATVLDGQPARTLHAVCGSQNTNN